MTDTSQARSGPSVHFDQLYLKLGGNPILSDITFTVAPSSIHCIIGPNGGGKTSLIRSLLGQMPHTGQIKIRWGNQRQTAQQATGYVPQTLDFDRTLPLTVNNFMTMICQKRPVFWGKNRQKQQIINEALERVEMKGKKNYLFGGLSGGERQRVLLAQALIPVPALLILDEPASGLDKKGSEIMHSLLQELKKGGTTILMIHHDLAEVKKIGDQVTCINQHVLFSGSPETTLTPETIFSIYSSAKE